MSTANCLRITCCDPDPFNYVSCEMAIWYNTEYILACGVDSRTDPIIIPAGTYFSTTSQAAADALAVQAAADQRFTNPCQ